MAASKSLTFDLFGRDRTASKAMRDVSDSGQRMSRALQKASFAVGVAVGAAAVGIVKFGVDSVKAFTAAQDAQNRLNFAFEKFPSLAGANADALRKLNSELQTRTRFEDDAIASAQVSLSMYDLTADQLKELTPLMLDYAAATGDDLQTAAENLGKALLGQGRALKAIGLDFEDAGDPVANYNQLIAGLSEKVQGFAERDAETASGKLAQLQNRFGDLQEKIGEALIPSLENLMGVFEREVFPGLEQFAAWFAADGADGIGKFVGWVIEYKDVLGGAATAVGVLVGAQWALNIAMDANPVGAIILGLAALITVATLVATNWDTTVKIVVSSTGWIVKGLTGLTVGAASLIQTIINAILAGVGVVVDAIAAVTGIQIPIPRSVDFVSGLTAGGAYISGAINAAAGGGMTGVNSWTGSGGLSSPGSVGGMPYKAMADGGLVKGGRGGVLSLIGEKSYDELVLPLKSGMPLGGVTYVTNVRGAVLARPREIAKLQRDSTRTARRQGFSVRDTYV